MFTRSQSQFSPSERGVSKQSSFGDRLEKKAALSTILSALSKKQSQEKEVLDNSRDKITRQVSLPVKWSAGGGAGKVAPRRPMSELIERSSSMYDSPRSRQRPSSLSSYETGPRVSTTSLSESDVIYEDGDAAHHSRVESLASSSSPASLSSRREDAPRTLPESVGNPTESERRGSDDVVVVSPSCVSRKRLSSGSDSVTVSTAFQVQGQPTASRPMPSGSDPWSSSVSVCVPFQVTEDQEVRALPLSSSPTRSRPRGDFPMVSRPLPEALSAEPAPVIATTSENVSAQKESILNRDVRQTPKSSATPEKCGQEHGHEKVNGTLVKSSAQQTCQATDITDGPRKAGEKALGPRARPQSTAAKAIHPKNDESAGKRPTRDAKKPTTGEARGRPNREQSAKAPAEAEAKPRARTLPFQRDKASAPDKASAKLSPRNTPKSRSVSNSPKVSRVRDSKSHNAPKSSAPDNKRPQSDPLVGDKLENAKNQTNGPPSLSQTGRSQAVDESAEEEALKAKLKHCELEKVDAQEKLTAMERQLSVLSLLEKEKLQLQRRLSDVTQELDKSKSEVKSLKATNEQEKKALLARHEKLQAQFEKSQSELDDTRDKKELLEEEKVHLVEENDKNLKEFDIYLDKIEKLTNENTTKMLDQGRLRGRLSLMENGLGVLKDCALQMKEENSNLRTSVMDFRTQCGHVVSECAKELEALIPRLKDSGGEDANGTTADPDREQLMEELDVNKRCVQTLLARINELETEKSEVRGEDEEKCKAGQESTDSGGALASVWEECCGLREKLESLQVSYDSQARRLEELETEREELKEEKKGLESEAKYLKNVLSYRQDTQLVQVEHKTSKQMQRMEVDLGAAEGKVKDLEGEVGRLQTEKQTLLMSILNLNAQQAREAEEDLEEFSEGGEDESGASDSSSSATGTSESSAESESASESEPEGMGEEDEEEEVSLEKSGKKKRPGRRRRRMGGKARSSDGDSKTSRRERYNFRRALSSMSTESEYSVYSMLDGDDEDSSPELDSEEGSRYLRELVKKLKAENRMLQARMDEVAGEREEVLRQFDKLCDDYDFLESRLDKIDEDKKDNYGQLKSDKKALKAQVRELEKAKEEVEESLKEVKDEKLALLKCLEMRNAEQDAPSEDADASLSMAAMEEIIARAQAFSQEEQKEKIAKREQDSSSEESSSDEEESDSVGQRSDVEEEQRTAPEGRPDAAPRAERDDELESIVASIENDLGKLKAKLHRKTSVVDGPPVSAFAKPRSGSVPLPTPPKSLTASEPSNPDSEPSNLDSEPEKADCDAERLPVDIPSPAERFLSRQASSVKVNLERVYREKQHLQGEVESLRQCFTRSLRRGSVATVQRKQSVAGRKMSMVAMADNQVEAIRTLQELLQRADLELKESNQKISHLEEKNAEADEKLKESELLQSDLRQAVVISHNFASEETEKAKSAEDEKEELLRIIRRLQKENAKYKVGPATLPNQPRRRLVKGRALSDDSSYMAESEGTFTQDEGESDFFSSRHSSVASESDLVQSPTSEGHEDPEQWPKQSEGTTSPSTEGTADRDAESDSRTSSTFSANE